MTLKTKTIPHYTGKIGDMKYLNSPTQSLIFDTAASNYEDAFWLDRYFSNQKKRNYTLSGTGTTGTSSIDTVNGKGKENPCHHVRVRSVNVPYAMYSRRYNSTYTICWNYYRNPIVIRDVTGKVQQHVDWRAAKSRAYFNMRPRFEGDISMLNFLYEMKDFRDIANALPGMFKNIQNMKMNVGNYLSRNRDIGKRMRESGLVRSDVVNTKCFQDVLRRNSRDVDAALNKGLSFDYLTAAAEAWLINAFAVQPLIRDVSAMLSQATISAVDAQQQFKTAGADVQTSHYSEKVVHTDTGAAGKGDYYWFTLGDYSSSTYTASCKYTYDYTMRSHYDAFMRYWGLSGSFEALWNATPWSFLVDYVVQVGKSIHAMERDPNVDWNILSWTDSVKWVYRSGYYVLGDSRIRAAIIDDKFFNSSKVHGQLLSGAEKSIYDRRVSQPQIGIACPKLKGPSLRQWLNVAALARCFF